MTELTSCCKNFQLSDGVTNFAVSYKKDAQEIKLKYCSVETTGHLFFLLQKFAVFSAIYYICDIILSTRPGNSGQRAEQGKSFVRQ